MSVGRFATSGKQERLDRVHASRLQGGSITWTLASDIDGLQLYSGNDPSAPRGVTSYVGVTEVMGTLDEVAALFKTDTAEGYHEYLRMFGTDHLDGQTLYTLATESTDRPRHHLSLQWSASAMPGLANPRDWCFLETTFNVVRGEYHRSGYIIMESPTRRGALVAMALHQIDWKGSIPSFATASAVRRRCRAVADLDTHLRSRRLRGLPFLPMHRLVPFALRVKCFVCCARFGVFGYSKESCRQCGEVV
ncbi:hypothetical protein DYB30_004563 [Aphanomyces astaci]|uniref:START domain-containing protein n=1 Tax=Aphanomyces astaci TaxID=112090 RepID=A0A397DC07_APHAT|nr:hypothetical protein DYB30_004563 [Aphanomyces astaci]